MNYEKMWQTATVPSIDTLQGKWKVSMVSGWLLLLKGLTISWYKEIDDEDGTNKIFGIPCLRFSIYASVYDGSSHCTLFRYADFDDYVRQVSPDKMIGQVWIGKKMLGYFTMERVVMEENWVAKCEYFGFEFIIYHINRQYMAFNDGEAVRGARKLHALFAKCKRLACYWKWLESRQMALF